jgi:hypothetical protein
MTTYTEIDFRQLFATSEGFDGWLDNEFLEVRRDGPAPGVWLRVDDIERMPQLHRSEKDTYLRQHPRHDLSVPVLPFPFALADFMALADSNCFRHSAARWPEDSDIERLSSMNPRTAQLMMMLLGRAISVPTVPIVSPVPVSDVPMSSPAPTAPTGAMKHSTKDGRRDILDPVIDFAQIECRDPHDTAEVWAQLQRMADGEHGPLLASTTEGVKYSKNGRDAHLTRDALDKRLQRRRKKHAT